MIRWDVDWPNGCIISLSSLPRSMIPATGNGRIPPERCVRVIRSSGKHGKKIETRKQYSGRKLSDFFECLSGRFPRKIHQKIVMSLKNGYHSPGNDRIHQEITRIRQEKFGYFRPEYCFHVLTFFRCFLAGTGSYFSTWVLFFCFSFQVGGILEFVHFSSSLSINRNNLFNCVNTNTFSLEKPAKMFLKSNLPASTMRLYLFYM